MKRFALLFVGVALVLPGPVQAQEALAEKPLTYEAGKADAVADIARGALIYKQSGYEFLPKDELDLRLERDFKLQIVRINGFSTPGGWEYLNGYQEVSEPVFEAKFGKDFVSRTQRALQQESLAALFDKLKAGGVVVPPVPAEEVGLSEGEREYRHGRAEAAADVAKGLFIVKKYGYETSGYSPEAHVLERDYGVHTISAGCVVSAGQVDNFRGYNEVSRAAVGEKFGKDVWAKVDQAARAERMAAYQRPKKAVVWGNAG